MKKFIMKTAYLACGCFWGAQYYLDNLKGVVSTVVGFMGGNLENPSYKQVKTGQTGHLETTEVVYNPSILSYENLVKFFFEIHDFEQTDGQGPDIGSQYLSAVFVQNKEEEAIVRGIIDELRKKGFKPATKVLAASAFYKAEDYHQKYLVDRDLTPECHVHKKIF